MMAVSKRSLIYLALGERRESKGKTERQRNKELEIGADTLLMNTATLNDGAAPPKIQNYSINNVDVKKYIYSDIHHTIVSFSCLQTFSLSISSLFIA